MQRFLRYAACGADGFINRAGGRKFDQIELDGTDYFFIVLPVFFTQCFVKQSNFYPFQSGMTPKVIGHGPLAARCIQLFFESFTAAAGA